MPDRSVGKSRGRCLVSFRKEYNSRNLPLKVHCVHFAVQSDQSDDCGKDLMMI
jgi:hypothetical protein